MYCRKRSNMRFRPRKLLTYLLIVISVVVILANFISYNSTTQLQLDADKHPKLLEKQQHDALLGPRNPNPVSFDERFKKYDEKSSPANVAPLVAVAGGIGTSVRAGAVSQTRIFHGGLRGAGGNSSMNAVLRGVSSSTLPTFVGRAVWNGSENEEYREQFVRRVRLRGSAETEADDPSWNVWVAKKDRKSEIVDDRIVKQMKYVPKRYSRLMTRSSKSGRVGDRPIRVRTIYVPGGVDAETPLGGLKFTNDKCPVSACNITTDSVHELTADLRLLQADAYFTTTEKKPSGQIWVLWVLESPANTADFVGPDNLINWTATYRWDSTLVTPYAKFVPFSSEAVLQDFGGEKRVKAPAMAARNYAANKTKMVAWFVSNCNAKNRRWEFAQELKKYIPVDIFGACGTIDCPRSSQNECNGRLNADYKFYLSFENSNCDHYVTEKFFENGLGNDVVPIVMGGRQADYLKAAPPNSYIHVDDFPSAEALAEYLLKLNASDHLYNEYFRWKGSGEFINTKFWCRLCALLHDDQRPNMWYTNFHRWWMHEGSCATERWEDMMMQRSF